MNEVQIKHCTYKDFFTILPILEAYSDIFNVHEKREIVRQATKVLDESFKTNTLYLVISEGKTVGFFGGSRNNNNPMRLDVFCLVIKRGYNGQGMGTTLFRYALPQLKDQGFNEIFVRLKASYPPHTKKFYKNLGFKPTFDDNFTGSSDEDSAMILKLK